MMEVQYDSTAPFLFVGGALVLDFVNTEIVERGKRRDLLHTPRNLMQWWSAARAEYELLPQHLNSDGDETLLSGVREFRATLRHFFERLTVGGDVDEDALYAINSVLRQGYQGVRFTNGEFQVSYESDDLLTQWCLPVALSAMDLLTTYDPARLHKCHNGRCILLFYDTTKSGTRQWCSLACLERERSSRRYRERKAAR